MYICRLHHYIAGKSKKGNGKLLKPKWEFSKVTVYKFKHRNQMPLYRKLVGKNNERPYLWEQ